MGVKSPKDGYRQILLQEVLGMLTATGNTVLVSRAWGDTGGQWALGLLSGPGAGEGMIKNLFENFLKV